MALTGTKDFDIELGNEKSEQVEILIAPTTYLDGLRGLAALLVYLSHHVSWWYGPDTAWEHGFGYHGQYMLATFPFVRIFFTGGSAAVAIFFVLSGYVLCLSPLHMSRQGKGKEVRSYLLTAAIRRPFRLFLPVMAVSLIFLAVMHLPFGLAPHLQWPVPEPTIAAELFKWVRELGRVMDLTVPHSTTTAWFPYDPPVWTMAAELKGSLVLFTLLAISSSASPLQRLAFFGLTGILLLFIYQWEIGAFMLGAAIAVLNMENVFILPNNSTKYSSVIKHLTLLLACFLLGQPAGGSDPEISSATPGWYYLTYLTPPAYLSRDFWRFWPVVGATMLIGVITSTNWLRTFLHHPICRYLGKISFCLYLIHVPVVWTIGDRLARMIGRSRFDYTTPFDNLIPIPDYGWVGFSTGFYIWQASLLPINLYLASIATKRIDEPCVRFGKWLSSKMKRLAYP